MKGKESNQNSTKGPLQQLGYIGNYLAQKLQYIPERAMTSSKPTQPAHHHGTKHAGKEIYLEKCPDQVIFLEK